MTTHIQGMGWVTPLGNNLDEVWRRLISGEHGDAKEISSPHSKRTHQCIPVPLKQVEAIGKSPRLRRSSAISYFTAAAGLAALENAGIRMTPEIAERTAIVFAVSSGGVVYTRKFHEQIAQQGAGAASPLLFPETVYNAPASHLAALLGVTGATYTLVGDSSVGLSALKLAEQLLETTAVDRCLVVGGEEVDWVLCEAYSEWRLGAALAEGGAAIVLSRTGSIAMDEIHAGIPFQKQSEAATAMDTVLGNLAADGNAKIDLVVSCANGTFIDLAEQRALERHLSGVPVYRPKEAFGESPGAGAIMQVIVAALALSKREAPHGICLSPERASCALVSCCGWNHQASGLILSGGE